MMGSGPTRRDAVLAAGAGATAGVLPAHARGLSDAAVTPFRVSVPQRELDELKLRLRLTRMPSRETAPGWTQGVPLDDISTYWFTNTGASSTRIYWESWPHGPLDWAGPHIELPMAVTVFPKEFFKAPRAWAEAKYAKLIYFNEVDRGGHFAAFEQPAIFSEESRKAFRPART